MVGGRKQLQGLLNHPEIAAEKVKYHGAAAKKVLECIEHVLGESEGGENKLGVHLQIYQCSQGAAGEAGACAPCSKWHELIPVSMWFEMIGEIQELATAAALKEFRPEFSKPNAALTGLQNASKRAKTNLARVRKGRDMEASKQKAGAKKRSRRKRL